MKKFLDLGNRYAAQSDWTDFALTKFCLCAMGILIGLNVPKKHKQTAEYIAGGIFAATYAVLMVKIFGIIKEMYAEQNEAD